MWQIPGVGRPAGWLKDGSYGSCKRTNPYSVSGTWADESSSFGTSSMLNMTTAAAIDRLVHHSSIPEINGSSYRNDEVVQRTDKPKETTDGDPE